MNRFSTCKVTDGNQRSNVRRRLRSAIWAGLIAGSVSNAYSQTELVLPSFPTNVPGLALPAAENVSSAPQRVTESRPSAVLARASHLLGIKNQLRPSTAVPPNAVLTLPPFPSASPALHLTDATALPSMAAPATASESRSPTISRSSGKSEVGQGERVVLASADQSVKAPEVVLPEGVCNAAKDEHAALALEGVQSIKDASECTDESASEFESESLIDIAIPSPSKTPSSEGKPRLPELVKRPPALQLQIGGNATQASASSDTPPLSKPADNTMVQLLRSALRESKESKGGVFSFSDSSDDSLKSLAQATAGEGRVLKATAKPIMLSPVMNNPMNVRIEGEPVVGQASASQAIARSSNKVAAENTVAPAVDKQPTNAMSKSEVPPKPVAEKFDESDAVVGERLEVGLHESINLELPLAICGVSIEHPEFCQALKNGERSLSLVGLKTGKTRVALFTLEAGGERKVEIREVLIAGAETRQADLKSLAVEISHSVHSMYPGSRIEVIASTEGLTVQGYAGTEEEAKKIISLVRRTSLQPVVDRLATYK